MNISTRWLREWVDPKVSDIELSEKLTMAGLEVEKITPVAPPFEGLVVGLVVSSIKHPNADKLSLCEVDIGVDSNLQIICGAPNVRKGQYVVVVLPGNYLTNIKGESFKIKKTKIRGEWSEGMICGEDEIGLGYNHEGIIELTQACKAGDLVSNYFKVNKDQVFEIGLTPNRADAMSHFGVARDLRTGLIQHGINLELISPSVINFHVDERRLRTDIEVENKDLVPRYCGISIVDVEVKDSPDWIKNRLKSIGITPKNNIVDITNYVLHELGQPLHAFDASKIKGNKVVVKTLESGTKFTTLDGVERELHKDDIMICDAESNPLCIAGVFGGINSGVTERTTSIFLESAYFNPVSIRKSAKRHALNTDASFRFERGIDVNFSKYALKRAALLIEEYSGGKIASDLTDFYPKKIEDFEVFLSYNNAFRIIGQEIDKETIKNILASLEIKIRSETEGGLGLTVPSYRVDVQREADIIEEILRVYGYNNIKFSHKLNASISFDSNNDITLENTIANQLTSLGFNETMSNSLTKEEYTSLSENLKEAFNVEMLNPLSTDLKVLRQSLLFSGLESISYNINRKNNALKFYEFGKTYHKYESGYQEDKHLTLLVTGLRNPESWTNASDNSDFFYLKGIITSILNRIGLSNFKTNPAKSDIFSEGVTLSLGKNKLVEFGVVKKKVLKEFGIKQEVLYADFDWGVILSASGTKKLKIVELPKFPAVKRDLSLLLDDHISFKEIHNLAYQSEKKLLKDVSLFDVYQGDKLPKGKKSYALSFTLQDVNKTLTEKDIEKTMKKLKQTFEKNLEAVLR